LKNDVYNRYGHDSSGFVIDIAADRVEDLYNNFDRCSPYIRRDLDSEVVDYIIDSAKEIGDEPFSLSFTLRDDHDEAKLTRIKGSVNTYFNYLASVEILKSDSMLKRALIFFGIGISILIVALWANKVIGVREEILANVFIQGLTVAAWVALWESLATALIEWLPLRKNISLYKRLADLPLIIRNSPDDMGEG
jgi:hypothetical protein